MARRAKKAGGARASKADLIARTIGTGIFRAASSADHHLHAEDRAEIAISYSVSLDAFAGGFAQPYHFNVLAKALGVGAILAENGLGAEYLPLLVDALDGLRRARARYDATGRFGFDGPALAAAREAFPLHDAQLEAVTLGELRRALAEREKRIKTSGLSV